MKNGIKIMNCEASEILKRAEGRTRINNKGEEVPDWKMKWKGVFNNSMLLDELINRGLNISKRKSSRDIIAVSFSYGFDGLINEESVELNTEELRKKFYINGFTIEYDAKDGKKDIVNYVFAFRSSSKGMTGDTIFMEKELYNKIKPWQDMGIALEEDKDGKVKKVEMEAYKALTSSSIEGYTTIKPSEILVINDLTSYTDKMDIISVEMDKKTNRVVAVPKRERVSNVLFDGQALLEDSLFTGEYINCGMKTLRQHFFKCCGVRTKIQKFIKQWCNDNNKDYETYEVKDKYDNLVLVKNIKMITTENAMKWEKLIGDKKKGFKQWCKAVEESGCRFGITKVDHPSKYGTKQRMSYQMINSLLIDDNSIEELCQETKDYIALLKNDNEEYIKYLKRTASETNNNMLLADLYEHNNSFAHSKWFKKQRTTLISEFGSRAKAGKLLCNGDNLTIVGNPYLMLLHSVGALDKYITKKKDEYIIEGYEDPTLPIIDKGISVYAPLFNNNEALVSFRSPHNSANNILYCINNKHNYMEEYFNFSNNIIAFNLIKTDAQARGSGFDADSDFVLTTNTNVIVQAGIKAQEYKTMVNNIEQSKKSYSDTLEDLADIDYTLAKGKTDVGETSNLAQIALSYYWDTKNKELEKVVCILAVLAQVAIDSVKRQYVCNLQDEMRYIRRMDCLTDETEIEGKKILKAKAKPTFWGNTNSETTTKSIEKVIATEYKKAQELLLATGSIDAIESYYSLSKSTKKKMVDDRRKAIKDSYKDIDCPMNKVIKKIGKLDSANTTTPIGDEHFLIIHGTTKTQDRKQAKKIELIVKEYDAEVRKIHNEDDEEDEEITQQVMHLAEEFNKKIRGLTIEVDTMSLLIARALNNNPKSQYKSNGEIRTKLLNILYKEERNRDNFLKCFTTDILNPEDYKKPKNKKSHLISKKVVK